MRSFFEATCLKPTYSLRRQLALAFGSSAFITLAVALVVAIICLNIAGETVKDHAREMLRNQTIATVQDSSRYSAERFAAYMTNLHGTTQLLVEIVQERIVGYPDDGWEDDLHVPFRDIVSGSNKYPLAVPPLPLDFEIDANVNESNVLEHIMNRTLFSPFGTLSTATASFYIQGNCDPLETNSSSLTYHTNCDDSSNDMSIGGSLQPTDTNEGIYKRSGDIAALVKPLFEITPAAALMGVYFHNSGAGASISYPGFILDGTGPQYTSLGCDWMNKLNPHTNEPYGTAEEIERCHSDGTKVSQREYNPMERGWCQTTALNGGNLTWYGPFASFDAGDTLISVGKAIFDQRTGHFIGTASTDISLKLLNEFLRNETLNFDGTRINEVEVALSIVRLSDNSVLADTLDSRFKSNASQLTVVGSELLISQKEYEDLLAGLSRSQNATDRGTFREMLLGSVVVGDSGIYTAYPIPPPPQELDPTYTPEYIVIHFISNDVFDAIDGLYDEIDRELLHDSLTLVGVALLGMVVVFAIVWCVSRVLTQPLVWMETVAWGVVNHTDDRADDKLNTSPEENQVQVTVRCSPKTEIMDVVSEFRTMINGFSGPGAATVAEIEVKEIMNNLTWCSDFSQFYVQEMDRKSSIRLSAVAGSQGKSLQGLAEEFDVETNGNPILWENEELSNPSSDSVSSESATSDNVPFDNPATDNESSEQKESGPMLRASLMSNSDDLEFLSPPRQSSNEKGKGLRSSWLASGDNLDYLSSGKSESVASGLRFSLNTSSKDLNQLRSSAASALRSSVKASVTPSNHDEAQVRKSVTIAEPVSDAFTIVPAPPKRNFGSNTRRRLTKQFQSKSGLHDVFESEKKPAYRSSLFWVILILMVMPLVATLAFIWGISMSNITAVEGLLGSVASVSEDLEITSLQSFADLRASFAEVALSQVARDLYLMTRLSSWLLFGGVELAATLTDTGEATEDCKAFLGEECPFYQTPESICVCEWQDELSGRPCVSVEKTEARKLQRRYFASQARDADPSTGRRNASVSFLSSTDVDRSPGTTLWWDNGTQLPGADVGTNASGFATAFDRHRVTSAMAIVDVPIYNYARSMGRPTNDLGSFVSFESDGMFTGYFGGCNFYFTELAEFESTTENGAAKVNSALCPLGKYGYDPRCRDWYSAGKRKYNKENSPVHITSPYLFATNGNADEPLVATSATSPIVNPRTGEYLGQMLFDFLPTEIRQALEDMPEPITFLITPVLDTEGGDTVVGPNSTGWESASITDLIMGNSSPEERQEFEDTILPSMKNGDSKTERFWRSGPDGQEEELVLAYAPVKINTLLPLAPDDFSRGVNMSDTMIYSVGIARPFNEIQRLLRNTEDDISDELEPLRVIYMSFASVAAVLFAIVSCLITLSITKPMLTLLTVVRVINARIVGDDITPLVGGSREVYQVYNTFSKLYKIVRMSNVAFFSGNLSWAYHFISDALKLFRKVKDEKAIGVACNNLGNAMHAMLREAPDDSCFEHSDRGCDVQFAHRLFDEAVDIAQVAFDEETDPDIKAELAHQVANRRFNRALFLLSAQTHQCMNGPDCKAKAIEDISQTRLLDCDVKDYWLDRKLLLKKSDASFTTLIRRMHGLVDFYHDDEVRAVWDAQSLVEEADQLLFAAWHAVDAPLFQQMNRVARLQQLEAEAIRLDLEAGRLTDAARLAMRMFSEDEYISEWSFMCAARALLEHMRNDQSLQVWTPKTVSSVRTDLRLMASSGKHVALDMEKCVVLAFEVSKKWEGHHLLERINTLCLSLFDECCSSGDFVGVVASTTKGDIKIEPSAKMDNGERQRAALDMATTSTHDRQSPSLLYVLQMLVDCPVTTENDSFIVLVVDGKSGDHSSYEKARLTIERHNHEKSTSIHVFILGLELEKDQALLEHCQELCSVSKSSMYVDVTMSNVDATFTAMAGVLTGKGMTYGSMLGIAMEKF